MSHVKFHHIRYFIEIANEKSLRAAARSLNLSQSALTRGLQELEIDLGVELVERSSRGIVLTTAGESYLLRAKSALEELRRGHEEATQSLGATQAKLTVGMAALAQMTLLPRVLPLFRKKYPLVNITIDGSLLPLVASQIDDGSMDFCIVPRLSGGTEQRFQTEKLWSSQRTILARRGHPLSNATTINDLANNEWIGIGERKNVEAYIHKIYALNKLQKNGAIAISESIMTAINYMLSSNAVMVGPKYITKYNTNIISINVKEHIEDIDVLLVKKHGLPLTPPAEYFLNTIKRYSKNIDIA
jgi:DNA-binding transcriptional LysR family regulator